MAASETVVVDANRLEWTGSVFGVVPMPSGSSILAASTDTHMT